jgi:hypothetical protein
MAKGSQIKPMFRVFAELTAAPAYDKPAGRDIF